MSVFDKNDNSKQVFERGTSKVQHRRPLVCVQGMGFVGAAMAVAVAKSEDADGDKNFTVVGLDLPTPSGRKRVDAINDGLFPFQSGDKTLDAVMLECSAFGNLSATTDPEVLNDADVVIVDVNMDVKIRDGLPDADFENLIDAITVIGNKIKQSTLVMIETTVPPGTCEFLILPLLRDLFLQRGLNPESILLAHSYERVMPGPQYLDSIINFWRVFSACNAEAENACEAFLKKILDTENWPLKKLSTMTASETAKILENTFRAVNIALIDEWSKFAQVANVDLFEVIDAIRDRPTHSNIRQPGFGVGGYCLTKDPYFAEISNKTFFPNEKLEFPFANLATVTNQRMPAWHLKRIISILQKDPSDMCITMMGVAYRSELSDTRNSASEIFYKQAKNIGIKLKVHDPHVTHWQEIDMGIDPEIPILDGCDAIVFCVPHKYYRGLDLTSWVGEKNVLIYDCDNVLSSEQIAELRMRKANLVLAGRGK